MAKRKSATTKRHETTKNLNDLSNPNLETVMKYISEFNKENPGHKFSLTGMFTARYGDAAVTKAILVGKLDNFNAIATNPQTQQLKGWLDSEKSVDHVFKILALSGDDSLSLMGHKLEMLGEYIKLFNSKNPQEKTHLFWALSKGSDGEGAFINLVLRMMAIPSTTSYGNKYQKELFHQWKKSDMDPAIVRREVFGKAGENNQAKVELIISRYGTFYNKAAAPLRGS